MKWCIVDKALQENTLALTTIAFLLKKTNNKEYEDANYKIIERKIDKEHNEYYVVLYNANEQVNEYITLSLKDKVEIDLDNIKHEVNYLKQIALYTKELIKDMGIEELNKIFDADFKIKYLDSFNGRGGISLVDDKKNIQVDILLNKMDLYELKVYKNEKKVFNSIELLGITLLPYILFELANINFNFIKWS